LTTVHRYAVVDNPPTCVVVRDYVCLVCVDRPECPGEFVDSETSNGAGGD